VIRGDERRLLDQLVKLAEGNRLVMLSYAKPGEAVSTDRLVEPYHLQESGAEKLMVRCWQLEPPIVDRAKWRNFRLDRILRLADGGSTFQPRCPVTIHCGEVSPFEWGHDPVQSLGEVWR
jgi:predicted DNA-binding transcriptional regulator YafY